ncbi:hypothetical protein [Clavibacter michiganensis]|uniref:Uncharacterized protein n=1 Tax=Clavibacter michiganensis subsp. insidiosus TaxID=33014 RepID=A0A0D5CLB4_9MICO|nr:hypothetical protein [Clavibacter michiganensis]AJW80057.1 hypothetical protein VO01_13830 [Clavibacter michiganensis subsp. insidiosus]AWF97296.1 hypothetical protein BEH61_02125 [Clavibacter michiganensis subsp. insidiosus]AWG02616.1 hypothetical protein BEH62_13535 [Clavibacter michiganensis subsp. insidiosus]OQJ58951.1 hypothetical protein B5P21_02845 [Clavibacter michiganensis subsp. insidiosus]RII87304.1 hypothetical protein DZF92_07360 [Clavibacter michiganensis subsp. insidiosus]
MMTFSNATARARPYGSTVLLLVVELVLAAIAYINNIAFSGLLGACGYNDPNCDYGLADFGYRLGAFGIPSVAVLSTVVTVVFIARRQPMRSIPIAGMALTIGVAVTALVITGVSIG